MPASQPIQSKRHESQLQERRLDRKTENLRLSLLRARLQEAVQRQSAQAARS